MDPWAEGFCFCAIILELLEEALAGTSVARACSRRGCPRQLVKSKVTERGDGNGVQRNEMLDAGGMAGRRLCERDARGKSYGAGGSRYVVCANNYWMTPGPVAGQQDTNGRDTAIKGCLLN